MDSGKETPAAEFSIGEGSSGSQPAAPEGVTVTVTVAPSSPLPVPPPEPVPVPVEDRDEEMVAAEEDKDSSSSDDDEMEGVEGDAPPPLEPAAEVQEGGDDVAAGEIAPAVQAVGDFACDICGARYPTEKAMFGHLRCHRDRGWRGAFSPPTFTMEEFAEYQEHLVKPEEEQLREIEEEERALAALPPPPAAEDGGERVVLDVDLNVEAAPVVEPFILPDLNFPPPDEE